MHEKMVAAIDLGTSKITLMAGKKNALGLLYVEAVETVESNGCIRRGCVYNVEETASKVRSLLDALNRKLSTKIGKVYIGVGGQSVRSMEHSIVRQLPPETIINKTLLNSIEEECRNYEPDMLALLDISSPEYYIDGRPEVNPLGVKCSEIEVKYQLIVGRPNVKRDITKSVENMAQIPIAGYMIAAEATAASVLFPDEKNLGCALVDIGGGTTTLSIYKNKLLKYMVTIPLGSDLITKDIGSLNILEKEAEEFKIQHGQAIAEKDENMEDQLYTSQNVEASKLNLIIEARMDEILANVMAQIEHAGYDKSLASGIIFTGGGAKLNNLLESLKDKMDCNVRIAAIQKAVLEEETDITKDPVYSKTVGLLVLGETNCAKEVASRPEPPQDGLFGEDEIPPVKPPTDPDVKKNLKKRKSLLGRLGDGFEGLSKSLFDDLNE